MHIQGIRDFHAFPQCKDIRNLSTHIGEWLRTQSKYASHMPPEHLVEFFIAILPDDVRTEVYRRRRDLPDLASIIGFVQDEIARLNDSRLSAEHRARQSKLLSAKHEPFAGAVT